MTPPWKTQFASDIIRDGMGLDLFDAAGNIVAEVFRCDKDYTVTVRIFTAKVPANVVAELIDRARSGLGSFEDGAPLPSTFTVEQAY